IDQRKEGFMGVAEQFAGLNMGQLIGGPLSAAADASLALANSTAKFINNVGFKNNGELQTVAFQYQKRSVNEDGTSNLDEMKVDMPLLAIVPIPNLQIDEVNILFDMEVKESIKEESSMDGTLSGSATLNLGLFKVSVSGSVSAHSSNTRSSDNSAKYHVDVRATNHGTPEGLARVLDMMAANISPSLVGSTIQDGNGQKLAESARLKAEKLKSLRQEISQIENRLNAAKSGLDNNIGQLKRLASSQQNAYQAVMVRELNKLEKDTSKEAEEKDETAIQYGRVMDEVNLSWNNLQNNASELIKMMADSEQASDGVSEIFALKALSEMEAVEYGESESGYTGLKVAQNNALEAQKKVSQIEEELFNKKAEYSDAVAGRAALPE
ncbi:MAG: DUF2589 domain-containing protein, partial [Lachnospiraceae bacterium]|nr:DUF2589 domain-containing protein [Lachnospiraceae bacterium]